MREQPPGFYITPNHGAEVCLQTVFDFMLSLSEKCVHRNFVLFEEPLPLLHGHFGMIGG